MVLRVAVLATGGKDSVLSLHQAMKEGHEIAYLATMIPLREDSWMFHYPDIRLVDLFSEAVGIPIVKSDTSGVKEEEVEDLKRLVAKLDVDGLVSGAIASEYQKTRIDKICTQLGLQCITPLWHVDPLEILRKIMDLQFEVIITGTYALGFDTGWLGRRIDMDTVNALVELNGRYGVSLVGEGGEYETLVLDAPFFKKRIKIVKAERIWKNQSGTFLISEAELKNK
jgi:ABC transporter with metal-binding/Fe-S-binding domain ATP-binding protein